MTTSGEPGLCLFTPPGMEFYSREVFTLCPPGFQVHKPITTAVVDGHGSNLKVTDADDLEIAERWLAARVEGGDEDR